MAPEEPLLMVAALVVASAAAAAAAVVVVVVVAAAVVRAVSAIVASRKATLQRSRVSRRGHARSTIPPSWLRAPSAVAWPLARTRACARGARVWSACVAPRYIIRAMARRAKGTGSRYAQLGGGGGGSGVVLCSSGWERLCR